MTDKNVSALLITDATGLLGIVTDRDLRRRCLAKERASSDTVAELMTRDVVSIGPESAAFEALMRMTQHGIHHLPVADNSGLRGLVSSTDLLRWQSANAVYIGAMARRAESIAELVRVSSELPEMQVEMLGSGATAGQIGQAISSINDLITTRLLTLAEANLGPAPVPYAWLACGSQGRHEQTVHSDQDNALILDDGFSAEAHASYFDHLARFVNDGLDACGYRYCPGDVMASNSQWRQPQREWLKAFRTWIAHTDDRAAMLVANFADLRVVAGDATLHAPLLDEIAKGTARHEIFLSQMVANTVKNKPPLGFFGKFVLARGGDHAHTFDSKRQGLLPIVDIARIHTLANARPEVGTIKRLRAVAAGGGLSSESASELEEAFEFLGLLRVRHQVMQIRRGESPDNHIDPDTLTTLERRHLRDVFTVVTQIQRAMTVRYGGAPD